MTSSVESNAAHLKRQIKRSARDDDAQISVKHKEGFADCIDDGAGQQTSVFRSSNGGKKLIAHCGSSFFGSLRLI